MCGITALSRVAERSSIHNTRNTMQLAALAIEERGTDATGFGYLNNKDELFYWKMPRRARVAVAASPVGIHSKIVIGHTRWKTQGAITNNNNNHPVVEDNIVLVHNGMISNDAMLFREHFAQDYVPKAEVDTQVIAALLANLPACGASHPTQALELLRGSAAVAWMDNDDLADLHLARVKERPMTIGWTRKGDLMMSSTPETLDNWATWANIKVRNVFEVPEGMYLRVREGQIVEEVTFKVPPSYTTTTTFSGTGRSGWQEGYVYRSGGGWQPREDDDTSTATPKRHLQLTASTTRPFDDDDDVIDIVDQYPYDVDDERFAKWNYQNLRSLHEQNEAGVDFDDVEKAFRAWQNLKNQSPRLDALLMMTDREYADHMDFLGVLKDDVSSGYITQEEADYDEEIAIAEFLAAVQPKITEGAQ